MVPGVRVQIIQSEASIQVMWSLSSNQSPEARSIIPRGQYPGHVITLSQSESSIEAASIVPDACGVSNMFTRSMDQKRH